MQASRRLPEAVHIMLLTYLLQDEVKLTSERMARSLTIDPTVVRRLMSLLKKAGLLKIPPKKGGARALRPAEEVTLWEVYQAVEQQKPLFDFHSCETGPCPVAGCIHTVLDHHLSDAQNAMRQQLECVTLADMYRDMTESCGVTRDLFRKKE